LSIFAERGSCLRQTSLKIRKRVLESVRRVYRRGRRRSASGAETSRFQPRRPPVR
jgi:hypothetical protein